MKMQKAKKKEVEQEKKLDIERKKMSEQTLQF